MVFGRTLASENSDGKNQRGRWSVNCTAQDAGLETHLPLLFLTEQVPWGMELSLENEALKK